QGLQQGLNQGLQQGLNQGLQQGLQQGMQQGERQARLADLRRILARRFGPLPIPLLEQLRRLSAQQLEPLLDTALDAATLAAFQTALPGADLAD
ncbi:MAG: DUF4351 domain-containing protein, partial [Chloroflexi bacterium]|nr:DUF4351 domain-containing protein [Chloroflexota bacterium]